jgi:hypothetical protein
MIGCSAQASLPPGEDPQVRALSRVIGIEGSGVGTRADVGLNER